MIENSKIFTGSPTKVESEMNTYLDSHPNATVLSSSIVVTYFLSAVMIAETVKPVTKGKAKTKVPESQESTIHNPQSPLAPQEQITVCVIVGIKH